MPHDKHTRPAQLRTHACQMINALARYTHAGQEGQLLKCTRSATHACLPNDKRAQVRPLSAASTLHCKRTRSSAPAPRCAHAYQANMTLAQVRRAGACRTVGAPAQAPSLGLPPPSKLWACLFECALCAAPANACNTTQQNRRQQKSSCAVCLAAEVF